ncbi:GNAT family N-acetyltransferase [Tepidibacillus fermentans]|uniref:L-amino acid N-acyltransferase YncA n=1 Tax=Tepidibacillus fermentans TaxID=1281767 RepID=A0A4R3KL93_9BACI|nr:GNAT family N-acetyltransferase [Tepidibacillus fermentans]TCS84372.1 L-amino acid N-acyltransferase YncA [Tepidibacillus fermentans]
MLIREARIEDAFAIGKVNVDSWRTTYKGIVSDQFLADLSYEKAEKRFKEHLTIARNRCYFVAENEKKEIIGFIAGGYNRTENSDYEGEIYGIYLLKHSQRKGIGRQLVKALAQKLKELGITSVQVWALADNPYRKFYKKLGGDYIDSKLIEIGSQILKEESYGWKDIEVLL